MTFLESRLSLSSELARRDGTVRGFLEAHFPEMGGLRERWNEAVGGIQPVTPNQPGRPPYSTIGTAFDYRLRFAFGAGADIGGLLATIPAQILSLLASEDGPFIAGPKGPFVLRARLQILNERPPDLNLELAAAVRRVPPSGVKIGVLLPEYFSMLTDDLARLEPSGKRLGPEDEDLLDRHCYVLALLDELFRGGYHIRSPLYDTPPKTPPHGLGLGLYSSRHGVLVTWPLNEFLSHASKQQPRPVAGLRDEFRKIVVERERI